MKRKKTKLVYSVIIVSLIFSLDSINVRNDQDSEKSINKIQQSNDFVEVIWKRSPSSRHYYNPILSKYRYRSENLVYRENTIDGTNWITFDEYPINYIIRERNGEINRFSTSLELKNYINSIDNSSIWGIGVETFNGIYGLYLNVQDTINGHAQALYYPRLRNGKLPPFESPLYYIFQNLYVKVGTNWYNQLLNNRSLYSVGNNPRDHLSLFETSDTFGMKFTASNIIIQGFSFDFVSGFKYNKTDRLFHQISEFKCNDRGFDDIGLAYEILSSPQSEDTPYEVSKFRLYNLTHKIEISKEQLWKAGNLINNALSEVSIISMNGKEFIFTFEDLSLVGFNSDYLELTNLDLPNGEQKKSLKAGKFNYGSYTQNTWIIIDPTFSERLSTTINDFDIDQFDSYNGGTLYGGHWGTEDTRFFFAYNTTINETIQSIENITMSLYLEEEYTESNEFLAIGIYDSEDDNDHIWDYDESQLDVSGCHQQTTYSNDTSWFIPDGESGNQTWGDSELSSIFDDWITWHNLNSTDRMFIQFKVWEGDNLDSGTTDYAVFSSSEAFPSNTRPTLTFDYLLEEITTTAPHIPANRTEDITGIWTPFPILSGFGLWIMDQGWILIIGCIFLFFIWKAISKK